MANLSCFLKKNAVPLKNVKYVASKRFVDTDKTPVEWEIRIIDNDVDELIRKECTKTVPTGKRGQRTQELDTDKYAAKLCAACTVFPNLNDASLQDDYGVKSADALLKKLLTPGEYTEYRAKVLEVNGYDMTMEDLVDEAKN